MHYITADLHRQNIQQTPTSYTELETRLESNYTMAEPPLIQVLYIEGERYELHFNHTRYVYTDLRKMETLRSARQVLYRLQMAGYYPIVMYPEQSNVLLTAGIPFYRIARRGGIGMVDAASIFGEHGKRTQQIALNLLKANLSPVMGLSAAASGSERMEEAYEEIEKWIGSERADMIRENRIRVENDDYIQLDYPSKTNYVKRRNSWTMRS